MNYVGRKREILTNSLPIRVDQLLIRSLSRGDLDLLSDWAPYPWPYDVFRFSFAGLSSEELDSTYDGKFGDECRIALVADTKNVPVIGYIAMVHIDWSKRSAENMAVRIRPDYCDRGIGKSLVSGVCDWWFSHGMHSLRLDVAATNHRAMKCYEGAGFRRTGEFWREAHDLIGKDLREPKYGFLKDDVDCGTGIPRIRFYWMERTTETI